MPLQDSNYRDFLARRFPRRGDVVTVIEVPAVALYEAQLPNEGSTIQLWHEVLKLVRAAGKFDALGAEVKRIFPNAAAAVDELAAAWRDEAAAPVVINLQNPYPGLRPFEEGDQHQFYGRERWILNLARALDQYAVVTLYGGSGSGKSSLLRAGLMPLQKKAGVVVALFTPGRDPFASFLAMGLGNKHAADALVQQARKGGLPGLFALVATACFPGHRLLVIVDQGEELYTRCEDESLRTAFLECLFAPSNDKVRVLLGIREDFFSRWNKTRAHDPDFPATNLSLTPPDEEDWRAIILEPARRHGVFFEANLPEKIIERLKVGRAGLPLLQFLLKELWQHDNPADGVLNLASYTSLGGVDDALRQHIQRFVQAHLQRDADIRRLLLSLVRFTRQDSQYRALSRSRPKDALPKDLVDAMMMPEWRLLTTRGTSEEVELSHEVLLRVWPGFEKLELERGELHVLKGEITDACTRWKKKDARHKASELWSGSRLEEALRRGGEADDFALAEIPLSEDERKFLTDSRREAEKSQRRARRLLVGTGLAAVLMLLLALGAVWFWSDAEEQRDKLDEAAKIVKQEKARADKFSQELIPWAVASRKEDEALAVMRTLARDSSVLESWEGNFLAKRFMFAPIRLPREQIAVLDEGPLKGSGLYNAAVGLYDGQGEFDDMRGLVESNGLRLVCRGGGRSGVTLEVRQADDDVVMARYYTSRYGEFHAAWVAPDLSCLMVLADPLRVTPLELSGSDSSGLLYQPSVYLLPLYERYCGSALQTAETNAPEPQEPEQSPPRPIRDLALHQGGSRVVAAYLDSLDEESPKAIFRLFPGKRLVQLGDLAQDERPVQSLVKRFVTDAGLAQVQVYCVDWEDSELVFAGVKEGNVVVGPLKNPAAWKSTPLPLLVAGRWSGDLFSSCNTMSFSKDRQWLHVYPFRTRGVGGWTGATLARGMLNEVTQFAPGDLEDDHFPPSVEIGTDHQSDKFWLSADSRNSSRVLLFQHQAPSAIWRDENGPTRIDLSEEWFAKTDEVSSQISLQRDLNGPVEETFQLGVRSSSDLLRESPLAPDRMLVGDTLVKKSTLLTLMQLPEGILLAEDWSWAAYTEKPGDPRDDEMGDWSYLRVITGLAGDAALESSLADKVRDFELGVLGGDSRPSTEGVDLGGSFEAREVALERMLGWPTEFEETMFDVPMAKYKDQLAQAPLILAEAESLLRLRPKSERALFAKVAALTLLKKDPKVVEALFAAQASKEEDRFYFKDSAEQWEDLAGLAEAQLAVRTAAPARRVWDWVKFVNGRLSDEEQDTLLAESSEPLTAHIRAAAAISERDEKSAAGWEALAELDGREDSLEHIYGNVGQLRRDDDRAPLWLMFCPDDVIDALNRAMKTRGKFGSGPDMALALADKLTAVSGKDRELGAEVLSELFLHDPESFQFARRLVRHGKSVNAAALLLPDELEGDERAAWLGRLALENEDSVEELWKEFSRLVGGRSPAQMPEQVLRSALCFDLARGDNAAAKKKSKILERLNPKWQEAAWTNQESSKLHEIADEAQPPVSPP